MAFGGWAFRKWLGWDYVMTWSPHEIIGFVKWGRERGQPLWADITMAAFCESGRGSSPVPLCRHPNILGFQHPELWKKKHPLCQQPRLWYFATAARADWDVPFPSFSFYSGSNPGSSVIIVMSLGIMSLCEHFEQVNELEKKFTTREILQKQFFLSTTK